MNNQDLTALSYRNYATALWDGKTSLQSKYQKVWLSEQKQNLQEGSLKKEYKIRIKELQKKISYRSDKIENMLLKQRFNFSAGVNGKPYSYRELLAQAKGGEVQKRVSQALIDETDLLIDGGFAELVKYRNKRARKKGYENYWAMINYTQSNSIQKILIQLDPDLQKVSGKLLPPTLDNSLQMDLGEAVVFFCSLFFARTKIPDMEVKIRKGAECPPGPAYVQPLEYRPGKGHLLGINLPFIHQNKIKIEDLGVLFHELTHLFHFASVNSRGNHAFPAELAANNLLYESEALCYQNLTLAAWKGGSCVPDLRMLKDLVYLAETERQLYFLETSDSKNIKKLIMRRIDEHYPDGNFGRTPLGASHLISGESAGRYWIYPAAQRLGSQRIRNILSTEKHLTVPSFWKEGNEASFKLNMIDLLYEGNIYTLLSGKNLLEPQNLQKRGKVEIQAELEGIGLYSKFMG